MARRKQLSNRTLTRIALRRAGYFSSAGYRQGCRDDRAVAAFIFFWLGLILTIFTGGNALPLTIFLMLPGIGKFFGWIN